MGTGDRHLLNNLRHHLHGGGGGKKEHHHQLPNIPKGCLAVMVGLEGEEKQRFIVPVEYLSHPLFQRLLKEAEEEYGFDHKGAIAIPCCAVEFRSVQGQIDRETAIASPHLVGCFRA
ncbi:unnamed protein product [Spirodela intermedia]|uniref:Uncharacterized protein n=1 Tax=Spirodela intermedia TaxID=51605 RepID=A0A7I8JV71_SPIIN|nr:unnamed protein product [Spirodela intermedia]CAA6673665.1 unnamed protein product [Spirodela intermedia]